MGSIERDLATDLARIIRATADEVADGQGNELIEHVTGHLKVSLARSVVVTRSWPMWEHANIQRGVDAYLAEYGTAVDWFGIAGAQRTHEDVIGMLVIAGMRGMFELGSVDFATTAIGPDEATEVVQLGLVGTNAPGGGAGAARDPGRYPAVGARAVPAGGTGDVTRDRHRSA